MIDEFIVQHDSLEAVRQHVEEIQKVCESILQTTDMPAIPQPYLLGYISIWLSRIESHCGQLRQRHVGFLDRLLREGKIERPKTDEHGNVIVKCSHCGEEVVGALTEGIGDKLFVCPACFEEVDRQAAEH